jgi:predicted metal-dependent hydrolase
LLLTLEHLLANSHRELSDAHENVCKELDDTKQIAELLKAEVEQLKVRVERCSLWIVPAAHSLFSSSLSLSTPRGKETASRTD